MAATKQLSLPVRGMTCASCVGHVEKALKSLAGVLEVQVNLMAGKAAVDYDPDKVSIPDMVKVVTDIGYEVGTEELSLKVTGMTCAACVNKVEKAIKNLPGVANAVVNLATESAKVEYYPVAVTKSDIKQTVEALGYNVEDRADAQSELDREREAREAEIRKQRRNMWLTWPLGLIAMLGTMREMWILDKFIPEWLSNNYTLWALTTPVVVIGGWQFFVHSWRGLKRGVTDMNLLYATEYPGRRKSSRGIFRSR